MKPRAHLLITAFLVSAIAAMNQTLGSTAIGGYRYFPDVVNGQVIFRCELCNVDNACTFTSGTTTQRCTCINSIDPAFQRSLTDTECEIPIFRHDIPL